jgi:hypothetical protein
MRMRGDGDLYFEASNEEEEETRMNSAREGSPEMDNDPKQAIYPQVVVRGLNKIISMESRRHGEVRVKPARYLKFITGTDIRSNVLKLDACLQHAVCSEVPCVC